MTTGDAATYLQVSRQRIDELGNAGALRRRRVGRFWLYTRADLDRWRDEVRQPGGRPKNLVEVTPKTRGLEFVAG